MGLGGAHTLGPGLSLSKGIPLITMPRRVTHSESDFAILPSTIPGAGFGLFAKVPIAIEDTIGHYTGELITWEELRAGRYAGSDYLLALTRNLLLAAEGPKANYCRYINHSEEPNAFLVVSTRWKTARIEAIEEIRPGEEIFFNYGEDYWPASGA